MRNIKNISIALLITISSCTNSNNYNTHNLAKFNNTPNLTENIPEQVTHDSIITFKDIELEPAGELDESKEKKPSYINARIKKNDT